MFSYIRVIIIVQLVNSSFIRDMVEAYRTIAAPITVVYSMLRKQMNPAMAMKYDKIVTIMKAVAIKLIPQQTITYFHLFSGYCRAKSLYLYYSKRTCKNPQSDSNSMLLCLVGMKSIPTSNPFAGTTIIFLCANIASSSID